MQTQKLISFDLQGTLSDSAFSDAFWLDFLPALYAKKYKLELQQAKDHLEKEFQSMGQYHELFYNHRLRLDTLMPNWKFEHIVKSLKIKPQLDLDVLNIVKEIPAPIPTIILSATTRDFINVELSYAKKYFHKIFSSIDDFNIPGKPPALFQNIAAIMYVKTENCLHIGDCREMDHDNAIKAGWRSHHLNKNQDRNERLIGLKHTLTNFITESA